MIDSRTGITDIAGITLRLLADEVVILAANNLENKEGSFRIIKSLLNKENKLFNNDFKINYVLTRIPFTNSPTDKSKEIRLRKETSNSLNLLSKNFEIPLSVIHSDRRLEENEQHLIGYEIENDTVSIENDYLNLFDIVCSKYFNPKEIATFSNKKKAEKLFVKAKELKDKSEKIELLSQIINLDENEIEYYFERGFEYFNSGNFDLALKDYEFIHSINANNSNILNNIGRIYFAKKDFHKALEHYSEAIKNDIKNAVAYVNKIGVLEKLGLQKEAFDIMNYYLININPDYLPFLNNRADILRKKKNTMKHIWIFIKRSQLIVI